MGMNTTLAGHNSFDKRETSHTLSRSSLHRARVTEVHINKGTVSLSFEDISYTAEAMINLMGLSAPVEGDSANFFNASWGRYIPQVGDMVIVGFSSNMRVYIIGYSAVYYKGFQIKDEDAVDSGGIGWGAVAEKQLKPGDWDFKSSRGSVLYLGDRAVIGSNTCKSTYNQSTNDIVNTSLTIINEAASSDVRYGAVRRLVLPTDTEESYIPSVRAGSTSQEFTASTRWDPGTGPIDLVHYSQGDVVEELAGTHTIKLSSDFLPVRKWFYSKDLTGLITSYEETIDSNGNVDIQANTATSVSHLTPLADWSITNRATSVTSAKSMDFTATQSIDLTAALDIGLTAIKSIDLTTLMVNLGGPIGFPLIKASPVFIALWATYFAAAAAAWTSLSINPLVSPTPISKTIFSTAAAGATAMAAVLVPSLTLKVKGE